MESKVQDHILIPKHIKLEKEKVEKLLKKLNITKAQLPRISIKDPAIKNQNVEINDVMKIIRNSSTAGKTAFYRVVVHE